MLPIAFVIAFTVILVESIKATWNIPKQWIWLLVLSLGAGANALNAYVFGGVPLDAVKEGLQGAAEAAGIYGMAKAGYQGVIAKQQAKLAETATPPPEDLQQSNY